MGNENIGKANRRISNIEPQNFEGWNRYVLSFLIQTEYITSTFDIRHSLFDICFYALNPERSQPAANPSPPILHNPVSAGPS